MRKKTFAGLFALALLIAVVCCFAGCGEDKGEATTAAATTVETTALPTEPQLKDQLYFNADKLLNKDLVRNKDRITGMYEVKLFINGDYEVFTTDIDAAVQSVDRFLICVPEFNWQGMFSGVKSAQSQLGGTVYDGLVVTGIEENVISVKSSVGSVTLATDAVIYDMTGLSAPVGSAGQIREGDKLCAYADDTGLLQVVYITERAMVHDDSHACLHCQENPAWTAWDGTQPLTSGHYQMTQNVTLEDTITLSGEDVSLCLNGFSLTCKNRVFVLTDGARLSITDHAGFTQVFKGSVSGGGIPTANMDEKELLGGTIYAEKGTELNLYGGELRSNVKNGTGRSIYRGATVYTTGTFNLHDGVLTGGNATDQGGGLYVGPGGSFSMDGGTMRYGNVGKSGGTAAFDKDCAEVRISGGKLIAGVAVKFGGGIYTEKSMDVTGGTFTGDLSDGVNAEYGGVFCVSNGAEVAFSQNVEFYGGSATEGGNIACRIKCHVVLHEGAVIRDGFGSSNGGNMVNFGILDIRGAKILNGHTKGSGGNIYSFTNGDTVVNLYDGEISGGVAGTGGNIRMTGNPGSYETGSILNVYGGLIENGEATSGNGGNIAIAAHSQAHFTGGTITGGKAKKDGGGVSLVFTAEYQVAARVFLGGNVRIVGNEGTDLFVGSSTVVEFEKDCPFTEDASVGLGAMDPTVALAVGAPQGAESVLFWREGIKTLVNQDGELVLQ